MLEVRLTGYVLAAGLHVDSEFLIPHAEPFCRESIVFDIRFNRVIRMRESFADYKVDALYIRLLFLHR